MSLSYEQTLQLLKDDMKLKALRMKINAQFERINLEALSQYPLLVGEPTFSNPATFDLAKMSDAAKKQANDRAAFIARKKLSIFLQSDVPKEVLDTHRDLFEKSRTVLLDKQGLDFYVRNGCITPEEKIWLETRLTSYEKWSSLPDAEKATALGLLYGVTEEGLVMLLEEQYESATEGFCYAFAPTASGMWLSFQLLQNSDGWTRFLSFAFAAPGMLGWVASYLNSMFGIPLLGPLGWGLSKVQTLSNITFAPVTFITFLTHLLVDPKTVALHIEKRLMRTNRVYGFMGSLLAISAPAVLLFGRYQYTYLMENLTQGVGTQVASIMARSPSASAIVTQAASLVGDGVGMMFNCMTTLFGKAVVNMSPEVAALFVGVTSAASVIGVYSLYYVCNRFLHSNFISMGLRTAIVGTLGLGLLTYGAITLYPVIFSYYLTMPITMYLTSLVSQVAFVGVHYIRTGLTNYLLHYAKTKASPAVAKRLVTWINRVGPVLDGLAYLAYFGLLWWNQGLRVADLYPAAVKYLPAWGKKLIPAGVADFIKLGAGVTPTTAAEAAAKVTEVGQTMAEDLGLTTAYNASKAVGSVAQTAFQATVPVATAAYQATAPVAAAVYETAAPIVGTVASGIVKAASKISV